MDAQYEFHERAGHPYAICALMCITRVLDWMAKTHPKDDVMFVFEKGDSYQGEVLQMLSRDKIDLGLAPMFLSKRWTVGDGVRMMRPLEYADFLAYEHNKLLTDAYNNAKTKARTSVWKLTQEGTLFGVKGRGNPVLDGRFFDIAARRFNLPRRAGISDAPIPREFDVLQDVLKDKFHPVAQASEIQITPRCDALPRLREA